MTTDDPFTTSQVPNPYGRRARAPFWEARAAGYPYPPGHDSAPATLEALRWLEFEAWEIPAAAWPTSGEYLARCELLATTLPGLDALRVDELVHSLVEGVHDRTGRYHFPVTLSVTDRENLVAQATSALPEGYRLWARYHHQELLPLVKWRQPTLL